MSVKYQRDIQYLTSVLTMLKNPENNGTEEIYLVTPPQVYSWIAFAFLYWSNYTCLEWHINLFCQIGAWEQNTNYTATISSVKASDSYAMHRLRYHTMDYKMISMLSGQGTNAQFSSDKCTGARAGDDTITNKVWRAFVYHGDIVNNQSWRKLR